MIKRTFKVTFYIDESLVKDKDVFDKNMENLKDNLIETIEDECDVQFEVKEIIEK